MLASARLSCFWPGLTRAWWRGSLPSLFVAVGFGWGLCLLMLATFVWPTWSPFPWMVTLGWLGMLGYWLVETLRNHWQLGQIQADAGPVAGDDRFTQAQREYLRGNWFEAESLLHALLTDTPRDAEAHLLLASVLRRSRRWNAAFRRLDQLELLDTSARWRFEIRRERDLIARQQQEFLSKESDSSSTENVGVEPVAAESEDKTSLSPSE